MAYIDIIYNTYEKSITQKLGNNRKTIPTGKYPIYFTGEKRKF